MSFPENGNGGNGDLFNPPKSEPEQNIAENIFETLKQKYSSRLKPEQILNYVYAVLYSNIYREKYAEFLKIDFPRIPVTADYSLFQQMAKRGADLIELHLLKRPSLSHLISKYNGAGDDDKIEKPSYSEKNGRVYINEEKYFDNVSPEIWNYHIGGYQVMEKYLKDRKDKQMDDPRHYSQIATVISKTIEVQDKIDKIFSRVDKRVIDFK